MLHFDNSLTKLLYPKLGYKKSLHNSIVDIQEGLRGNPRLVKEDLVKSKVNELNYSKFVKQLSQKRLGNLHREVKIE